MNVCYRPQDPASYPHLRALYHSRAWPAREPVSGALHADARRGEQLQKGARGARRRDEHAWVPGRGRGAQGGHDGCVEDCGGERKGSVREAVGRVYSATSRSMTKWSKMRFRTDAVELRLCMHFRSWTDLGAGWRCCQNFPWSFWYFVMGRFLPLSHRQISS